jgi:hypothetical protein
VAFPRSQRVAQPDRVVQGLRALAHGARRHDWQSPAPEPLSGPQRRGIGHHQSQQHLAALPRYPHVPAVQLAQEHGRQLTHRGVIRSRVRDRDEPSKVSLDLRPGPHAQSRVGAQLVVLQRGLDGVQPGLRVGADRVRRGPGLPGQLGRVNPQCARHRLQGSALGDRLLAPLHLTPERERQPGQARGLPQR